MQQALDVAKSHGLEIVTVSYRQPSADLQQWVTAQGR
jgi:hypothetical protein